MFPDFHIDGVPVFHGFRMLSLLPLGFHHKVRVRAVENPSTGQDQWPFFGM